MGNNNRSCLAEFYEQLPKELFAKPMRKLNICMNASERIKTFFFLV